MSVNPLNVRVGVYVFVNGGVGNLYGKMRKKEMNM